MCCVRIKNLLFPEVEDGRLYILDLAGSETNADSLHHSPERIKESVLINKSLAVLKECLRTKTQRELNSEKHIHVPFRQSKIRLGLVAHIEVSLKNMPVVMQTPTIIKVFQFTSNRAADHTSRMGFKMNKK